MYVVTRNDRVRELAELPQSSIGAPCPMILVGEHSLRIAYYLEEKEEGSDGTAVRLLSPGHGNEPCAVVDFVLPYAHMFGPPNDEAFAGHPLAERGLKPYGAFEVEKSSWLATLERMNSVHPYHRPDRFEKYRHFILSFHDTTFECIAEDFTLSICLGSVDAALRQPNMRPNKSLERTRER
jgi:hypothetical protein